MYTIKIRCIFIDQDLFLYVINYAIMTYEFVIYSILLDAIKILLLALTILLLDQKLAITKFEKVSLLFVDVL